VRATFKYPQTICIRPFSQCPLCRLFGHPVGSRRSVTSKIRSGERDVHDNLPAMYRHVSLTKQTFRQLVQIPKIHVCGERRQKAWARVQPNNKLQRILNLRLNNRNFNQGVNFNCRKSLLNVPNERYKMTNFDSKISRWATHAFIFFLILSKQWYKCAICLAPSSQINANLVIFDLK